MLYKIEGVFRVAIQVNDDDVVVCIQQLRNIVQVGIGGKLPCHVGLRTSKRTGYRLTALLFRPNQRN